MSEALQELAAHIGFKQPDAVLGAHVAFGELTLDVALPLGYHQLTLTGGASQYQQQLIITPQRCFQLHDKAVLHKTFGPAIQLYAVKSARNWGIGDFADLEVVVRGCAPRGAEGRGRLAWGNYRGGACRPCARVLPRTRPTPARPEAQTSAKGREIDGRLNRRAQ